MIEGVTGAVSAYLRVPTVAGESDYDLNVEDFGAQRLGSRFHLR